eukprot:6508787-Alexandrium_andersonii.AAC.1
MQDCFTRSNLELIDPKSSPQNWSPTIPRDGLRAVFRTDPNQATNTGIEGGRSRDTALSQAPARNPPVRNPCNP